LGPWRVVAEECLVLWVPVLRGGWVFELVLGKVEFHGLEWNLFVWVECVKVWRCWVYIHGGRKKGLEGGKGVGWVVGFFCGATGLGGKRGRRVGLGFKVMLGIGVFGEGEEGFGWVGGLRVRGFFSFSSFLGRYFGVFLGVVGWLRFRWQCLEKKNIGGVLRNLLRCWGVCPLMTLLGVGGGCSWSWGGVNLGTSFFYLGVWGGSGAADVGWGWVLVFGGWVQRVGGFGELRGVGGGLFFLVS